MITVGIDASNIRAGGGVTHLVECLGSLVPERWGIAKVVLCSIQETLDRAPERVWLERRALPNRIGSAIARIMGGSNSLLRKLASESDVMLIPGGSYTGSFRPFVSLAQNLLPFDVRERARTGLTLKLLRLHLLERIQRRTFRRASGVIFMTEISRAQIESRIGFRPTRACVVHHGTNPRFFRTPRRQRPADEYSTTNPFRLLYVSIIEPYKHQGIVIEAVAKLRRRGFPLELDLIGPASPQEFSFVTDHIRRYDPDGTYLHYLGAVQYDQLDLAYAGADAFVFASSCETFGIILLEAMAAGLPLVCSHRSAMPEVAGSAAVYFDPLSAESLGRALEMLFEDRRLRESLAFHAQRQARLFLWTKCADETFHFVSDIHNSWQRQSGEK